MLGFDLMMIEPIVNDKSVIILGLHCQWVRLLELNQLSFDLM